MFKTNLDNLNYGKQAINFEASTVSDYYIAPYSSFDYNTPSTTISIPNTYIKDGTGNINSTISYNLAVGTITHVFSSQKATAEVDPLGEPPLWSGFSSKALYYHQDKFVVGEFKPSNIPSFTVTTNS